VRLSIRKWYLDVVTDDGRVAIAYRAEVRHGPLHHDVSGVTVLRGAAPPAGWRFSMRSTHAPTLTPRGLGWSAPRLGLEVEYERLEPGFGQRLLQTRGGAIDWHCTLPRCRARVRTAEGTLEGLGYAEHLEMAGIAPWRIPADEIRWGRFLGDDASVVWLDWRGATPLRRVFVNGRVVEAAALSDDGIALVDGTALELGERQAIADETLGDLLSPLGPLRALVLPIVRVHQTRWRSRGELRLPGMPPMHGWALHELLVRRHAR